MIKIFNKKTDHAILIDEKLPQVHFKPMDYQERNPHIFIELEGLNFSHHAVTCEDCSALIKSFGTKTVDWHIEYLEKVKRLDLSTLGNSPTDNHLSFDGQAYFLGTRLKLNIDTDTVETLEHRLQKYEADENYEGCSIVFDKLNAIKDLWAADNIQALIASPLFQRSCI